MRPKTILVTGGAGFIGSHIVDTYVNAGHHVFVIDNLSNGVKANVNKKAKLYVGDILNQTAVTRLIKKLKVDIINHQAAQSSVSKSQTNPALDVKINVIGTLNLLKAARLGNVKQFIFASTAAVYGNPVRLPVNETHPIAPISPYGVSKFSAEHYLIQYCQNFNHNYVILRYSNVYGPRQKAHLEGGVIAIFLEKLSKGEIPTIYGNGEQTRDFIFVGDVAKVNLFALEHHAPILLNVGTGVETSINMVYKTITKLLGSQGAAAYAKARTGDIAKSRFDVRKLKKLMPRLKLTQLEDGISQTQNFNHHAGI